MSQSAPRLHWTGFTASQASPVHRRATSALSLQVHLGQESNSESELSCTRTQHNTMAQTQTARSGGHKPPIDAATIVFFIFLFGRNMKNFDFPPCATIGSRASTAKIRVIRSWNELADQQQQALLPSARTRLMPIPKVWTSESVRPTVRHAQ